MFYEKTSRHVVCIRFSLLTSKISCYNCVTVSFLHFCQHSGMSPDNYELWDFGVRTAIYFITSIFLLILLGAKPAKFFSLTEIMFGIKHVRMEGTTAADTNLNPIRLYFDSKYVRFDENSQKKSLFTCLWLTATVIIATTLSVFFNSFILDVVYLPPSSGCPSDGDMDCFGSDSNATYFACNSSDTRIPEFLKGVTCYRWFKKGISTVDVLEKIGLSAGLVQVFSWCVYLHLSATIYVSKRRTHHTKNIVTLRCESFCGSRGQWLWQKRAHPWLLLGWSVTVSAVITACILLYFINRVGVGVRSITLMILIAAVLTAISLFIFGLAWNSNDPTSESTPPANASSLIVSNGTEQPQTLPKQNTIIRTRIAPFSPVPD